MKTKLEIRDSEKENILGLLEADLLLQKAKNFREKVRIVDFGDKLEKVILSSPLNKAAFIIRSIPEGIISKSRKTRRLVTTAIGPISDSPSSDFPFPRCGITIIESVINNLELYKRGDREFNIVQLFRFLNITRCCFEDFILKRGGAVLKNESVHKVGTGGVMEDLFSKKELSWEPELNIVI